MFPDLTFCEKKGHKLILEISYLQTELMCENDLNSEVNSI
jgi:hypothetical protein